MFFLFFFGNLRVVLQNLKLVRDSSWLHGRGFDSRMYGEKVHYINGRKKDVIMEEDKEKMEGVRKGWGKKGGRSEGGGGGSKEGRKEEKNNCLFQGINYG